MFDAVDCFAGPGGWDEGAAMLGLRTVGLEMDHAACQTATTAGHARIRTDLATYPVEPFAGVGGHISSPPCQAWSMAGKRKGELDRANCHRLADRMAAGDDSLDWTEWEDARSPLVCQPIRWVRDQKPEWVALEEVPAVLGLWEHFARILQGWGYSVWVGVLNAADYGVPQTRKRAILMAHRSRTVQPPVPTHSKEGCDGDLFGNGRARWVSMAEALGWGFDGEPSATVSGGGTETGGAEPFGNAGYRRRLASTVLRMTTLPNSAVRTIEEPAPTIAFGKDAASAQWFHERPATTIIGSYHPEIVSPPGYRTETSRQNAEGGVRVTVAEGGVLQSFRPDYPWQGSRTKQYQQVSNAIPPLLAAHVLSALTGIPLELEAVA